MNTVEKGDKLEDEFFDYLEEQRRSGQLVYGAYPPELIKISKKKTYYCAERGANVEFDIVIEVFRKGANTPHFYVVFECKNHRKALQERDVVDFSDKLSRIFKHAGKGVLVVTNRLQSGAENIVKKRKIGVVKYDGNGIEVVAERKSRVIPEIGYVKSQILASQNQIKSLRFSAFYDDTFFSSVDLFLCSLDPHVRADDTQNATRSYEKVPFISPERFRDEASRILNQIDYRGGSVNLEEICDRLSINLEYSDRNLLSEDGCSILGRADFRKRTIQINSHSNKHRERFTLAHEIGHFLLCHDKYILSDTVVENDLFSEKKNQDEYNLERLEFQANTLASEMLLPTAVFQQTVKNFRQSLDIKDRGHGYIFVDDQRCNLDDYYDLCRLLISIFDVSAQVIEIKLKKLGLLIDERKGSVYHDAPNAVIKKLDPFSIIGRFSKHDR
jgi:Zn-dependent peptidase ImmA (M78 family)